MEAVKNKVQEIKYVDEQYKSLKIERDKLLEPALKDVGHINQIAEWIYELCDKEEINTNRYDAKHYILFLIPFLYSPRVLIQESMAEGIRTPLSQILNVSECHISNSYRNVYSWWVVYSDFRSSIDYLYYEILNRIEKFS